MPLIASSPEPPLLAVRDLVVRYAAPRGFVLPWRPAAAGPRPAVDGVSFELHAGETLAVVGESGSGKSSLARALVGLVPVAAGSARLGGTELVGLVPAGWRPLRRRVQMVFQDPIASLDPRQSVLAAVVAPMRALLPELRAAERERRALALLERVGLPPALARRRPSEFSGGQCQRVAIARALAPGPALLVCDEPVSALDVSVQAQVLNLLAGLQRERGLAMLFISHDLAVVAALAQRVLVLRDGKVMEAAPTRTLFTAPRHPYTQALLAAVPGRNDRGEMPVPAAA